VFIVLPFTAAVHAQRVAVLDIEVANSVTYVFDVADANQRALDPGPVPSSPALISPRGAFSDACQIDDIVAVNGKPAKGVHMTCLTRVRFNPNAQPGAAIADVTQNGGRWQCAWELLTEAGKFVGRFVDGGFFPHAVMGGEIRIPARR
jgi:hypothetical protein